MPQVYMNRMETATEKRVLMKRTFGNLDYVEFTVYGWAESKVHPNTGLGISYSCTSEKGARDAWKRAYRLERELRRRQYNQRELTTVSRTWSWDKLHDDCIR